MPFPFAGFGGFLFRREEHSIWGTDVGWALTPAYNRTRILGSSTDVITTLSIGSAERTFELNLTPERFAALQSLLNTSGLFTDWGRPSPDSRMAFLSDVTPLEDIISNDHLLTSQRKRRARVTLVSA